MAEAADDMKVTALAEVTGAAIKSLKVEMDVVAGEATRQETMIETINFTASEFYARNIADVQRRTVPITATNAIYILKWDTSAHTPENPVEGSGQFTFILTPTVIGQQVFIVNGDPSEVATYVANRPTETGRMGWASLHNYTVALRLDDVPPMYDSMALFNVENGVKTSSGKIGAVTGNPDADYNEFTFREGFIQMIASVDESGHLTWRRAYTDKPFAPTSRYRKIDIGIPGAEGNINYSHVAGDAKTNIMSMLDVVWNNGEQEMTARFATQADGDFVDFLTVRNANESGVLTLELPGSVIEGATAWHPELAGKVQLGPGEFASFVTAMMKEAPFQDKMVMVSRSPVTRQGTTAQRPAQRPIGTEFFDTALGKPIWWKGEAWVDATGAAV